MEQLFAQCGRDVIWTIITFLHTNDQIAYFLSLRVVCKLWNSAIEQRLRNVVRIILDLNIEENVSFVKRIRPISVRLTCFQKINIYHSQDMWHSITELHLPDLSNNIIYSEERIFSAVFLCQNLTSLVFEGRRTKIHATAKTQFSYQQHKNSSWTECDLLELRSLISNWCPKEICDLRTQKKKSAYKCQLTFEKTLSKLTKLEKLICPSIELHLPTELMRLTHLYCFGDALWTNVPRLTNLQTLELDSCDFIETSFVLENLPKLTSLNLINIQGHPYFLSDNRFGLTSITFVGPSVEVGIMRGFATSCTNLKNLSYIPVLF